MIGPWLALVCIPFDVTVVGYLACAVLAKRNPAAPGCEHLELDRLSQPTGLSSSTTEARCRGTSNNHLCKCFRIGK